MQPFTPWTWRDSDSFGQDVPPADELELTETARRERADLSGYDVEATDGGIGSIDETSHEVGGACIVVDTGPWIFGRKVVLPAGTIERVDHTDRKVYVDRTKEQIKDSPPYDPEAFNKPDYRSEVGQYYENSYRNYPPAM